MRMAHRAWRAFISHTMRELLRCASRQPPQSVGSSCSTLHSSAAEVHEKTSVACFKFLQSVYKSRVDSSTQDFFCAVEALVTLFQ